MDTEKMAKINKFLKAHGKLELSLDEVDKIVGGIDGGGEPDIPEMTSGAVCPHCGSTNTLGIDNEYHCWNCDFEFKV